MGVSSRKWELEIDGFVRIMGGTPCCGAFLHLLPTNFHFSYVMTEVAIPFTMRLVALQGRASSGLLFTACL